MTPGVLALAAVGLVALIAGADLLVRGAGGLALRLRITPLVVGLTVVAFGTSAPELAVSVQAGLAGQADLALGNVVGSNIFNVLLILGLSAVITPLAVAGQLVRLEVPLFIGAGVLLLVMALDGRIGVLDGILLAGGIVAYTAHAIRESRSWSPDLEAQYGHRFGDGARPGGSRLLWQLGCIVGGLALLVLGADWLVEGAVATARWLELSELVIGLTIVAAGTSLPEVATSVVAALRGERDIAVGNVLGSCLFNILCVAGVAAAVTPGGLSAAPPLIRFDLPVMIAVSLACMPVLASDHRIARWEGALFLAYYAAYVAYLILAATRHDALPAFNATMLGFVLPLTGVALTLLWVRHASAGADAEAGR